MPHRTFDIISRLGTQVVYCTDRLPLPVIYDEAHEVAFISAGLDDLTHRQAADWLLAEVALRPSR